MADSSDIHDSEPQSEDQRIDLAKRRRFLAAGLFAAPVVMTLTTRPVLARDKVAAGCTPSVMMSLTNSQHLC
jgi:hypothetical protein